MSAAPLQRHLVKDGNGNGNMNVRDKREGQRGRRGRAGRTRPENGARPGDYGDNARPRVEKSSKSRLRPARGRDGGRRPLNAAPLQRHLVKDGNGNGNMNVRDKREGQRGRSGARARGRAGRTRPENGARPGDDARPRVEKSSKSRLRPAVVAGSIRVWARSALRHRVCCCSVGVVLLCLLLVVVVGGGWFAAGLSVFWMEPGRSPKIFG